MISPKLIGLEFLFLLPVAIGSIGAYKFNGWKYWTICILCSCAYAIAFRIYRDEFKKIIIKEDDYMYYRLTGRGKNLADDKAAVLPVEKK